MGAYFQEHCVFRFRHIEPHTKISSLLKMNNICCMYILHFLFIHLLIDMEILIDKKHDENNATAFPNQISEHVIYLFKCVS